jgi:hypothetical protein
VIHVFIFVVAVVFIALFLMGRGKDHNADGPVLWMVELEQGKVKRFEGSFPPVGWRDVQDIAMDHAVSGTIHFRAPGAIEFSDSIAGGDQQRFRNVLARGPASHCLPSGGG